MSLIDVTESILRYFCALQRKQRTPTDIIGRRLPPSNFSPESLSKAFEIPACIPDLTDHIVKDEHPEATSSHEYHICKCTLDRPNYPPVTVAVKIIRVLQPENASDLTKRYNELLEEIKVWGRLQNEHILPVLGHVYGHGHLPSLVFPWMENGSLTNFLRERKTLERGERFRLLQDIASALQYLHVIAVVHGDLTGVSSYQNQQGRRALIISDALVRQDSILVDSHGRAFVTGVGLSMRLNETTPKPIGEAALRWTAPELVFKKTLATSKSDVWSFGLQHDSCALWAVALVVPLLPQVVRDQAQDSSFLRKCFSFPPEDRPSADQTLTFVRETLRTEIPQTAEAMAYDHDKGIPPVDQHAHDKGIPDVVADVGFTDKLVEMLKPETITEEEIHQCGGWSRQSAIELAVVNRLKYAILSHRWGESEPTFQDLKREGAGYKKLEKFCSKAKEYGCRLAWSDTCCINKESSSELDEAIRSIQTHWRRWENDEWFFRGWTLQELLAPLKMRFYYGPTWTPLTQNSNDKDDAKVVHALRHATNIPANDLRNFQPGPNRAWEKMSWAASRKTTRIEDVAYSLTGIFDITMTVAYGEGDRAFKRFMAELIERCKEWQILVSTQDAQETRDLVVGEGCGDDDFSVTKRGVQVKLFMVPASIDQSHWQSTSLSHPPGRLRTWPLEKLVVQSPFFPPASTTEWAIGIVNYQDHDDDANKGKLKAGQIYVCFLLRRVLSSWPGYRAQTTGRGRLQRIS
ncbi:kinase-like domain-containing protein [Suillus subalutaceus]|uniref:kinase-like domain-containing protein n=1 Tax=Suillus subalutaceus TaxID=48586 RepID=UPI001B872F82|nr:kinase-like domain-containing protein [Suillus subalutaceus]KAG1870697.1 kinase-like domain-containing protein [Suillus subalutaceus]